MYTIRNSIFFVAFLVLFVVQNSKAQSFENGRVQRKIALQPYCGVAAFPTINIVNELGMPINIFNGYIIAPTLGVNILYKFNQRFFVGLNTGFLSTHRNENTLNILRLGLIGKLNLIDPYKYIFSPYIMGGINVSFLNIYQYRQIKQYILQDTNAVGNGLKSTKIEHYFNQMEINMSPVFGPIAGVGLEAKLSKKISLFVQVSLETSIGTNGTIRENFPMNTSMLSLANFQAGTTIRLFKKTKVLVDTSEIVVPEVIAQLSPYETENQTANMHESEYTHNLHEGVVKDVVSKNLDSDLSVDVDTNKMLSQHLNLINSSPFDQVSEKKMHTFYNEEGFERNLNGIGFQVGAFVNVNNGANLMKRLVSNDFEVVEQNIMSHDITTRFKTSKNIKLQRIIVFAGVNEIIASDIKQKLLTAGFQIITKEYFVWQAKSKYITR